MEIRNIIKRILKESHAEKVQKTLDKYGLVTTLKMFGNDINRLSNMLHMTEKELLEKYNPFETIFTDEEFENSLFDTMSWMRERPGTFYPRLKNNPMDNVIEFIIDVTIDDFHSKLVNFETTEWIIPDTPKLLYLKFGDLLKNNSFFKNLYKQYRTNTEKLDEEMSEYARTLKNARQQGAGLRFPKSAIKANPNRFRPYNREEIDEADPKVGTGKKPEGSSRRLYTDENPKDTVSVKFRTKEDIVDTLNKESFKSKPHKRQSQIINLIHQRVRAAYQNAKDPETKKRLKRAYDYIETQKEKSKQKTIRLQKEGLHDTFWENDEGDRITLIDLLDATKDIPIKKIPIEKLKSKLLSWDGDEDEIKKIDKADLQYPILIFVEDDGSFISIIDGHHRAQKAIRKGLETIKAKIIPINSLPKNIRKVFSHMGKQGEIREGELTEKCWPDYTQKGMKTMFGKRYPNCVKKTKK
jgi:hypothetical protein